MKSPRSGRDVSKDWLSFMLTEYETHRAQAPVTASVITYQVNSGAKPGEGFNGELVLLNLNAEVLVGEEKCIRDYSLIAKFLPPDVMQKTMLSFFNYQFVEYLVYSKIIEELNSLQEIRASNQYRLKVPEFVFGRCNDDEYVIVMMNMKLLGYRINAKEKGLDLLHMRLAIDQVAKLHALSYVYNQDKNFLENNPKFSFNTYLATIFKPIVGVGYDNAVAFLRSLTTHSKLANKMAAKKVSIINQLPPIMNEQTQCKVLCLSHGDFWNNNIMYKYDDDDLEGDNPKDLIIIDWQMTKWSNPMFDLHYILQTSTTLGLRSKHLEEILLHYHTVFTNVTSDLGTPVQGYSYKEFKNEYDKYNLIGFFFGLSVIQGTLSKAGEKMFKPASSEPTPTWLKPWRNAIDLIKEKIAKGAITLSLKPSLEFISREVFKRLLKPVQKELISGNNQILNGRLLDFLMEADSKGIFD